MEKRKNPEKDLRKQQGLFFQIGLLIALMLCVSAFEYRKLVVEPTVNLPDGNTMEETIIPITIIDPPPPPPKPIYHNPVEITEEEIIEELPVIHIDTDEFIDIEPPEIYEEPTEEIIDDFVLFPEVSPEAKGGMSAFYQYLSKNINYPAQARRIGVEGKVFVQFIVDTDGKLTNVEVIKGIGGGCDEEALRVVKNAPAWNPGKQRAVPVRVRMVIPVTFSLGN